MAIESQDVAAAEVAESGSAFLNYLGANWHRFLILIVLCAFLVYAVFYMRKRFPIVREFLGFLRERKLWWMMPIVIVFLLLAIIIVTMESSALAPFIYPIFG